VISLTPVVEAATPPAAVAGSPFSFQIEATGTPTFGIASGELPSGLSLNTATGLISGTPTGSGTHIFVVSASNAGETRSVEFSITVSGTAAPAQPELAATGADTGPALLAAGLLLAGGIVLAARPRTAPRPSSRG
jgi:hypothetical protein